ncbi:phytoene desaturase family protein [Alkalihalobacterium elongatum]|uniref:phytoene desaturase family protein n=1 Tax=Alkalihalobacterium elongatum TaxID=2675466 RepID=UPI001C1FD325|nr:phytoene desaturase family protein [Alkalihalobacterium elongatum]
MKKVVIIGGGLGGLAAATLLAFNGYGVTLFEKNTHVGGKLKRIQSNGYIFDFGPNTITMPCVFRGIIEQTGQKSEDYFQFQKLDIHTNNHFSDGSTFSFSTDVDFMISQLNEIDVFGATHYQMYLKEVTRLYELSQSHFLPRTFSSLTEYLSPSLSKAFLSVRPFENLDHFHRRYFKDQRVRQSFNRYATYIGSSPYLTPATFAMIAHLELIEGVYYTTGGNASIAEGLAKRAKELGVHIHLNQEVSKINIKNQVATSIKLTNGETIEADEVILNGDLLASIPELIDESHRPRFSNEKIKKVEPSISAYVLLVGLNTRMKDLIHHQVYFSQNYKEEFNELSVKRQLPKDPSIYICNSSYTDLSMSPYGDNLFILVNAPPLSRDDGTNEDYEHYKEVIYKKLSRAGLNIRPHIEYEQLITPQSIKQGYNAFRGALYGRASNRKMDAFFRTPNRSRDIANLYFVGGSTHPGGGSPMVVISGQNVANLIINSR